ncbi:MAG: DUF1566 domain-containing protein [Methylococcales bacterium]|nr:DUF1566 domain-containing protein [Methylococcales bacterium]
MIRIKLNMLRALAISVLLVSNMAQASETIKLPDTSNTDYKTIKSYKVGESGPLGGKVYFIDETGQHGLEAKTADELNSATWNDAVTAASAYNADWHLPTITELKLLYEQRNSVGGFTKDDYWSSTELDSNSAWIQGFLNGDQDRYNKYSKLKVRAVRAF